MKSPDRFCYFMDYFTIISDEFFNPNATFLSTNGLDSGDRNGLKTKKHAFITRWNERGGDSE